MVALPPRRRRINLHHAHIAKMATAKAPMLMKPAMSDGEAPPEKNDPGCWGKGVDAVGKGMKVVVVLAGGGGVAEFVSVEAVEAEEVTVSSPGNRLGKEEDDIAGGQGDDG